MLNSKRITAIILALFMIIGSISVGASECKGGQMRGGMDCAKGEMKMSSECAKGEMKCEASECKKGEMKCEASECKKGEMKCEASECAKGEKKCEASECAKGEKKCDSSECEKECKEECGAGKENKEMPAMMVMCPFFNAGRMQKMLGFNCRKMSMLCAPKADKE